MTALDFNNIWYAKAGSTPQLRVFGVVGEGDDYWDGTYQWIEGGNLSGSGTEMDPYQIITGNDLAFLCATARFPALGTTAGNYYKMMNDIYLNDTTDPDWMNKIGPAAPRGWDGGVGDWYVPGFSGHLDGNGHIISGLYINGYEYSVYMGLFCAIENAVIENLGIVNSYINEYKTADFNLNGVFAGTQISDDSTSVIRQCFSDETVTINGSYVGGIIGRPRGTTIENCYSSAILGYAWAAGGIAAVDWESVNTPISNCYNTQAGTVLAHEAVWAEFTDCYTTGTTATGATQLTLAAMTGSNAKLYMPELDFDTVWYAKADSAPALRIFGIVDEDTTTPGGDTSGVWNGIIPWTTGRFANGSGTKSDPYQIITGNDLALLSNMARFRDYGDYGKTKGKYYKIMNDIYLNDTTDPDWMNKTGSDAPNEWNCGVGYWATPDLPGFSGHLDGDGHIINGIYINGAQLFMGLFGIIENGVIENLGIMNSYINNTLADGNFNGAFAGTQGSNNSTSVIRQCFSDETVTLNGTFVGGIIGRPRGTTIENCYSSANLVFNTDEDNKGKGGIAATDWPPMVNSKIINCYNTQPDVALTNDASWADFTGCYTIGTGATGATKLTLSQVTGAAAKTNMKAFDFENIWYAKDGNTPVLRKFKLKVDDTIPPVFTGALSSSHNTSNSVTINWPTASDTVTKAANMRYTMYSSSSAITPENLASATRAGTVTGTNSGTISGLALNTGYYVAVAATDESDNITLLSGGPFSTGAVLDTVKPVFTSGAITRRDFSKTTLTLRWPGATDNQARAVDICYTIYYSYSPINIGNLASATEALTVTGITTTVVEGLTAGKDYYIAVTAADTEGNFGILSGGPFATEPPDTMPPRFTGTITLTQRTVSRFVFSWPLANDNETLKEDIIYKLYYSTAQITNANLSSATLSGTFTDVLTGTVIGLTPATNYYVAVTASDELNNTSVIFAGPFTTKTKIEGVWDGETIASDYAGGNGTESNPYQIATAEQLALLCSTAYNITNTETAGKYYQLTADIYMNNVSDPNWKLTYPNEWTFGTGNSHLHSFLGTLDGQGHFIKGLYINEIASTYSGLFVALDKRATVKNLGVLQSFIRSKSYEPEVSGDNYAGAIAGTRFWDGDLSAGDVVTISQCFSDNTVTIEGAYVGGIIGGARNVTSISNCFSGAVLNIDRFIIHSYYSGYSGGIVGNEWTEGYLFIKNCYNTQNGVGLVGYIPEFAEYNGCYTIGRQQKGLTTVSFSRMLGEKAKEWMPELDFTNVWKTLDGFTPVQKIFTTYEGGIQPTTTITFETNYDVSVAPVTGFSGTLVPWPNLMREGYRFDGWYVYKELDVKYPMDVFPDLSITLYAKWTNLSIIQDFEAYPFTMEGEDGLGWDYQLFRPGTFGYSPLFTHGGGRSMHRIGDEPEDSNFLLFDYDMPELELGGVYKMSFWIYIENADNLESKLSLLHTDWIDAFDLGCYTQQINKLGELKMGEWQKVEMTFIASTKYLAITTPGFASIYFDDFDIIHTGKTDKIPLSNTGNPEYRQDSDAGSSPVTGYDSNFRIWTLIVISFSGYLLILMKSKTGKSVS